jgi:hypothetical protein
MEIERWLADNSFSLLGAVCGIGSLWFTAISLRSDIKTRQVANLLTITANHRQIWTEFLKNPALARIHDAAADTSTQPVSVAERVFVNLVIAHTYSVYCAMSNALVVEYDELRRDIAEFLSLPIPNAVWQKTKLLQNQDFVEFIESSFK